MRSVTARDNGEGGATVTVGGAGSLPDPRFRLVRGDDACLQANGKWASNKADLSAPATPSGGDLVLELPAALCENTEETTYYFELTGLPGEQMSVSWPGIIQPIAQRGTSIKAAAAARAAATPPPNPIRPAPESSPPPPPLAPAKQTLPVGGPDGDPSGPRPSGPRPSGPETGGSGRTLMFGIAAAGLAACIAAALFALKPWQPKPTPVAEAPPAATPAPTPETPAAPSAPAPDADAMSVAELARGEPAIMLEQALKRMATKPAESLLLLEVAGSDKHYGPALVALGKLYDPLLPRQGGVPADARQAAKAYQDAARQGDASAAPEREALRQKLVQQRDGGDMSAKLTVQDFWP